jgi:hypothetical protein
MEMLRKVIIPASLLSVLLAALPLQPANGEALWVIPESNRILVEYLKPSFASGTEATFGTSTWFLSGNAALGDVVSLTTEIPYTMLGVQGGDTDVAFGNAYLGAQLQGDAPVIVEFGFRLPTASKFNVASLGGMVTDYVDRAEAFIPNILPVTAAVSFYDRRDNGLIARLRGGINFWLPQEPNEDAELFLVYGGQAGMSTRRMNFLAGITGRWWLSNETGANVAEASEHQVAFSADVPMGVAQPGVSLRVPFDDDLNEILDFTFGIHFAMNLGV